MPKYVFLFEEATEKPAALLGNKGKQLAEMTKIGLPVPPGYTITTDVCSYFYAHDKSYPKGIEDEMKQAMKALEEKTGKKFGDPKNPLLVSVRSGASVSMPGMMDTVLNLGLNDDTVKGMIDLTKDERFALDSYRRFITMFGDVVMGVPHHGFEDILNKAKKDQGVKFDSELNAESLKNLIKLYKALVKKVIGKDFPMDVWAQLLMGRDAIFGSWMNPRAVSYRRIADLPESAGTAVNVQAMVFGNMDESSATGVGFTRNPATGENKLYGEYLINAQGEDIVAGIRTPHPIAKLAEEMPGAHKTLLEIREKLKSHYKDMQDFEFTVEKGTLYMLQTRNGKRTAAAAVKIAVDMVKEGLIDEKTAVMRVDPNSLDQLLHPRIDPDTDADPIAKGLPASPGAATGRVYFTAESACSAAEKGEKVVLVRTETSPEDIEGMNVAKGILTARGGMTSHAAVVARGMGKCCVAGCDDITVNEREGVFKAKHNMVIQEGETITLDGTLGRVFVGSVKTLEATMTDEFETLMKWADKFSVLGVRTNADVPKDAQRARDFGAKGIGLCRTEHMFFDATRIKAVREMIVADDEAGRKKALEKLKPFQKEDFKGIFKVMGKLPVTIRLLDPPLHEFLPKEDKEIKELASELGITVDQLKEKIDALHELNPMLGHRGCRLGLTYPEIYNMQVEAIMEAACECKQEGIDVFPEIMIPLIGHVKELEMLRKNAEKIVKGTMKKYNVDFKYMIGTMIEIPRAAVTADEIAKHAQFFSFGTNDLTQMGFGFSRDDAGKFIKIYIEQKILPKDPFQVLDQEGIGKFVELAVERGRKGNPDLEIGICGEHGGEPESIDFCHRTGLDYVSCSPFRVPIARLAAAQAAIRNKK